MGRIAFRESCVSESRGLVAISRAGVVAFLRGIVRIKFIGLYWRESNVVGYYVSNRMELPGRILLN